MRFKFNNQVKEVIAESRYIALAFSDKTIHTEHFILAMLKLAPDNVAVRYLETVMPKVEWQNHLEKIARDKAPLSQQPAKKQWWHFIFPSNSFGSLSRKSEKVLKYSYLEAKLLETYEIGLSCLFLSILRDTDFDGNVDYKTAQNFIKNSL